MGRRDGLSGRDGVVGERLPLRLGRGERGGEVITLIGLSAFLGLIVYALKGVDR